MGKGERWRIERHTPNDPGEGKENRHGHAGKMKHHAWDSELTPEEYWRKHVDDWTSLKMPNILVVKYENLISSLDYEMGRMADYFGVSKGSFENVDEKVSMHHVPK